MSNRVLVLVGLPGSGKSTLAKKIITSKKSWERVNQDEMRSRKACEMNTKKFLTKHQNVIVDRCNFDRDQRRTWIDLANHYQIPVDCIVLTADQEECTQRIQTRENHPTGVTGPDGVRILRRFVKDYRPPTPEFFEGFRRILYLEPNPEPEYSDERIDEIFELLEECPLLIEERNPIPRQHIPPPLPDQDGWTTMPNKQ